MLFDPKLSSPEFSIHLIHSKSITRVPKHQSSVYWQRVWTALGWEHIWCLPWMKKLALSGSKHTRPLLSHLGTKPKQEIHFLSSGLLLYKSLFLPNFINSFKCLIFKKPVLYLSSNLLLWTLWFNVIVKE